MYLYTNIMLYTLNSDVFLLGVLGISIESNLLSYTTSIKKLLRVLCHSFNNISNCNAKKNIYHAIDKKWFSPNLKSSSV